MELGALCRSCGLCCDGTLFERVSISAGEAEALTRRAVPVEERLGKKVLPLPCPGFRPRAGCAVYDTRPESCRRFLCTLGRGFEAGRVSLAEAEAIIARARSQRPAERPSFVREHFLDG